MGNCISCVSNTVPSSTVKVIHWNGSVQDFQRRIKAAELMLDNPHHFVCHANGLQIGRRINPLTADEELELGHLYFLLPMPKLHSVLSGTDMASLAFKANSAMKAAKGWSSGAKVLPLFDDFKCPLPPEKKNDVFVLEGKQICEEQEEQFAVPKLNFGDDPELLTMLNQLSLSPNKSWKPLTSSGQNFEIYCSQILSNSANMDIPVRYRELLTANMDESSPLMSRNKHIGIMSSLPV